MSDTLTFSAESTEHTTKRGRTRLSSSAIVAASLTTIIAVSAFSLSFYALAHLARMTGVFPEPFPYVMPVIVDLFVLQATFSLVTASAKHDKKGSRYHWFMLAVFSGASIIGNAYHAVVVSSGVLPAYVSALIAVVPPLALLASTHGLVNLLWDPSMAPDAESDTAVATADSPAAPHVGEGSGEAAMIGSGDGKVNSIDREVESPDHEVESPDHEVAESRNHEPLPHSTETAPDNIPDAGHKPSVERDDDATPEPSTSADPALDLASRSADAPPLDVTPLAEVAAPSTPATNIVAALQSTPISRQPEFTAHAERSEPEPSAATEAPSSLHALARGVPVTDEHRRLARIVRAEGSVSSDVEEIATVLALSDREWTKASIAKVVTPHRTTITRWIELAENLQDEVTARLVDQEA